MQNIFFIKGVFPSEVVDDSPELTEVMVEQDDSSDEELGYIMTPQIADRVIIEYEKIPDKFVSIDNWKKKSMLRCWHCDLRCDAPCFIPLSYNRVVVDGTEVSAYNIYGCFYSFKCATWYLNNVLDERIYKDRFKIYDIYGLMISAYEKFYGVSIDSIEEAPPKTIMIQYGGDLPTAEYEKLVKDVDAL